MMRLRDLMLLGAIFFLNASSRADISIAAGSVSVGEGSDAPEYILADQILPENNELSSIALPINMLGTINSVAIDPNRGTVIYVGNNEQNGIIYVGSVTNINVTQVVLPSSVSFSQLSKAAFDSDGNAIICGKNQNTLLPMVLKLAFGAKEVVEIAIPEADEGILVCVGVTPSNRVVFGGINSTTGSPLIYVLPQGASSAVPVSLPDQNVTGIIYDLAVDASGTTLFVGQNTVSANGEALIYSLLEGSLSASTIATSSSDDYGELFNVAFFPDGTAIAVGDIGTVTTVPLIYQILPGSNAASLLQNPNDQAGTLSAVAAAPDGTAILVGSDYETNIPLIYKIPSGSSYISVVGLPNENFGALLAVAVGSENIAIMAGSSEEGAQGLLFTLSTTANAASLVETPISNNLITFNSVAVYSENGLYDIRRLRPYYYLEINNAKTLLNAAGLP